jgi:hypothetical protein
MCVCSGSPASAAPPLPGHSWVVGPGVDVLGPPVRADPRTSWMLSPPGSGRVSLMSFWGGQVRGEPDGFFAQGGATDESRVQAVVLSV